MVVIVVNQYNRESSCHSPDLLINPFLSHRFIDGTFKVVRKPFVQLLTVNAFVKKGEAIKQLAFLYIIMSRRKKKDYVAVSCRLMEVLGYIKTFKLCPSTPEIALDRQPSQGTPDTFNSYKNLCPFILLRHWVFFWTRNAVRCNLLVSPAFTFCLLG